MKPEELDDLNPFDLFDIEAQRLDRFFGSLDGDAWNRPSQCLGWSVRDVLAHLAGEELYNHACLDGDVEGFHRMLQREDIRGGYRGFNEWCVEQRRDLPVEDVLAEWREANGDTRRRMRERGRTGHLATSVGPYPAGLQAFHYASEYATHADDVGAPVEPGEEPGRTAWRVRVGLLALDERHSPVEVSPVDDRLRVAVGNVDAELSPPDFVLATVNRLPADHPLPAELRDALVCLA